MSSMLSVQKRLASVILQRQSRHLSPFLSAQGHAAFSSYPPHTIYPMPALSPTMETGTIAAWNFAPGDSFSAGDVICSVETDKATVDFEAQDDGIIAKILREGPAAVDIKVGTPICVVVNDQEDVSAFKDFVVESTSDSLSSATTNTSQHLESVEESSTAGVLSSKVPLEHILMPAARHLSHSKGFDATGLKGSGKGGRVTKGDVLQALQDGVVLPKLQSKVATSNKIDFQVPPVSAVTAQTTASPPPALKLDNIILPSISSSGAHEDVINNNMRKVIAKRLTESKSSVPHFYSTIEIELDNILALRKKLAAMDVKVSVNDLIIRASALALRDVPEVNASFSKGKVKMNPTVDVSVAVATPGGLITPIVSNTDKLGLGDISSKVKDLATRARDGKLKPEEYQGGTFCISNLGMFGINEFSAVINPPQAAILAVGGGVMKVVATPYIEDAKEQIKPAIRNVMSARLSADRRVVDEPTAALFLGALRHYLITPELLML